MPRARRSLCAIMVILLGLNVVYSSFAWHRLRSGKQALIEQSARTHVRPNETVNVFALYPGIEGKSRLDRLGVRRDVRSAQQLVDDPENPPDWIFAMHGELGFVEDARRFPARARMLREQAGFRLDRWRGIEDLGYDRIDEIVPATPWWFFLDWMPAPREHRKMGRMLTYRHGGGS